MLKDKSGQVIIVILLLMTVALTVGLSISTQTATDTKISAQLEESERAFSAAEAGIEEALITSGTDTISGSLTNQAEYQVSINRFTSGHDNFVFPKKVAQDDTKQVWLVGHNSDGSINEGQRYQGSSLEVYWGDTSTPTTTVSGCDSNNITPAVEVTLIYKDAASEYQISKDAYDPDASGRTGCNNFSGASTGSWSLEGQDFRFRQNFDFSAIVAAAGMPYAVRVRLLYNSTREPLAVAVPASEAGNTIPSQGKQMTSTGKFGNTRRKVVVFESYPALPGIFDYVLFSGTGLTK